MLEGGTECPVGCTKDLSTTYEEEGHHQESQPLGTNLQISLQTSASFVALLAHFLPVSNWPFLGSLFIPSSSAFQTTSSSSHTSISTASPLFKLCPLSTSPHTTLFWGQETVMGDWLMSQAWPLKAKAESEWVRSSEEWVSTHVSLRLEHMVGMGVCVCVRTCKCTQTILNEF